MNAVDVPRDWAVAPLEDLCVNGRDSLVGGPFGSDLTSSDYQLDPGIPVIRGTNLGGDTGEFVDDGFVFVSEQKARLLRRNSARPGDLIFTQRGTLGQVAIIPSASRFPQYVISQSQMRMTPDITRVSPRFIFHFFRSPQSLSRISARALTTGVPHINLGILRRFPVAFPSVLEQHRIADTLDRAEALRAKRRAALAQLDTLTQAIFFDMFGDPESNPKGFQTGRLQELCTRITDGTHQPPTWATAGHPFLFVSNIISGEITFDTKKFISDQTHAELTSRCPIDVGDVLYSTVGSYGVPVLVRTARKFAFQRHIAHIKPNHAVLDPAFLRAMLASASLQKQADRVARGVAQKTLNLEAIRDFIVVRPPLNVQKQFGQRTDELQRLRQSGLESLSELDALFASLQHRAFRGEL